MLGNIVGWGRRIPWHRFAMAGLVVLVAAIIIFVYLAYTHHWAWTGFVGTDQVARPPVGQERKTLWDWMQLLLVPVFLAVATWGLNLGRRKADLARERERAQQALQEAYLARISQLLLEHGLKEAAGDSPVLALASMHTVDVLRCLEEKHRNSVIAFLREANLLYGDIYLSFSESSAIPLLSKSAALLEGAHMDTVCLEHANLRNVNLGGAVLSGSRWREVVLSYARLRGAWLTDVDMRRASLNGVDMSLAGIFFCRLNRATLRDVNLRSAALVHSDLRGSDFGNADLREVLFDGTNLRGAVLEGANLMGRI